MSDAVAISPPTQADVLELVAGHQLFVSRRPGEALLRVTAPNGTLKLSIRLTDGGDPVLHFESSGLVLQTEGDLEIGAQRVAITGREAVILATGGDLLIRAEGQLNSIARVQSIVAELGNVNIRANDDVNLNGERVRANC